MYNNSGLRSTAAVFMLTSSFCCEDARATGSTTVFSTRPRKFGAIGVCVCVFPIQSVFGVCLHQFGAQLLYNTRRRFSANEAHRRVCKYVSRILLGDGWLAYVKKIEMANVRVGVPGSNMSIICRSRSPHKQIYPPQRPTSLGEKPGGRTTIFGDTAVTKRAMVYTITLTNPLASGHDGSWKCDLLMECVVGTPAENAPSPLANGDPPPQVIGRDHRGGEGAVSDAPADANGSGGGASADTRGSQHPRSSDNEEVDDISSDEDDENDDDGGDDGAGDGEVGGGGAPDTSAHEADYMDASEISEDEDGDDDDDGGVAVEGDDVVVEILHQTDGATPRETMVAQVAGGVGDGARTDGAAAVETESRRPKEQDQQQENLDLSSVRAGGGGVEREAESSRNVTAAATDSTGKSNTLQPQQPQPQQQTLMNSSSGEELSSEDETITKAVADRRKQPGSPAATQLPGLDRPADGAGHQKRGSPLRPSPPPSPPASPTGSSSSSSSSAESSISHKTAESSGDDSESAFDGSDENSSGCEGETDDDDSDGYEMDFLPPTNCFSLHQNRKTYKKALCFECYTEYVGVL